MTRILQTIFLLTMFSAQLILASDDNMRDYIQDFSNGDPSVFWTGDGTYVINFKGIIHDEKSGRNILKIDVTSTGASYVIFKIPLTRPFPAENEVKISTKILLGKESEDNTTAGAGVTVAYPPTSLADCTLGAMTVSEKDKWIDIKADLNVQNNAATLLPGLAWKVKAENVGKYIESFSLTLAGKNKRTVLCIDSIYLQGKYEKDYDRQIAEKWAPVKQEAEKKASSWNNVFSEQLRQLENIELPKPDTDLNELKTKTIEILQEARKQVKEIQGKGWIAAGKQQKLEALPEKIKNVILYLNNANTYRNKKYLLYVVNSISSDPILPMDLLVRGDLSSETVKITASRGEYEPGSFVIKALSDINNLTLEISDLKSSKGNIIPSAQIDARIVKCWYQSGSAWVNINQDKRERMLVPELLLKDESLVYVDHEKHENYLKLKFPDKEIYECISSPEEKPSITRFGETLKILKNEDFPVYDAKNLLPLKIKKNQNQQFWVTVHIPDNAKSDIYEGNISLKDSNGHLGDVKLKICVLPVALLPPYYTPAIYYSGAWNESGNISGPFKNRQQIAADMENMFAHGIRSPLISAPFKQLGIYLKIMNETGMARPQLYYVRNFYDIKGSPLSDSELVELGKTAKKVMEFCREYGYSEVYFYGLDEARGKSLFMQQSAWETIKNSGGRVFVTGRNNEGNFKIGLQDLHICGGYPSKKEAFNWHSIGSRIWCYANPQGGVENPEINRRNFGLMIWANNYDGIATWAYQGGYGNIWNDFDDPTYRDHCFTYPGVDGPIDTLAWEGYREAIDDIRYLTTLLQAIDWGKKSEDRKSRDMAFAAEAYLNELDIEKDLDSTRQEMIKYILELTGNALFWEEIQKQ